MKSGCIRLFLGLAALVIIPAAMAVAQVTPLPNDRDPWGQRNRDMRVGNFWDQLTNRHYGGFRNAFTWPGGWWDVQLGPPDTERRTFANYKGFVIGAVNVPDPQYPAVVWPYMVGQRDGWNDGERGNAILDAPPDPAAVNVDVQILFKGRYDLRTFRQANAVVTVNGVENPELAHIDIETTVPEIVGDEDDSPYQDDVIDPTIPADLTLDTYSWSRMGVGTNRRVYAFVDRNNDDYMFWHWRMINDGIWARLGIDSVDCCGGTHGTVEGVMMSLMFQWDRASAGAERTASNGEQNNDTIWRYYGIDYDGAQTEDMRLVYAIDGDQDATKYSPAHGKQNDIGDPDPNTGALLSAKTGGWQILHYDVSTSDRNDDVAQPRTMGWQHYNWLIRTGTPNELTDAGHEAKYNQMLLGYLAPDQYYLGPALETPGRGRHPNADTHFASWIRASNAPDVSALYWPGKVLGVDPEVTDCEQQAGFGPDDMAPYDTLNAIFVVGVKGIEEQYAQQVGADWLAGNIDDAAKDAVVHSTIDSLFDVMRQAKKVYEAGDFGGREASTRAEFEQALLDAMAAGDLTLSPPQPATFDVAEGPGKVDLAWTLNTTTGSDIAGWRVYRALANYKGDSAWTVIADLSPATLSYADTDVTPGFSYYYYLVTYDADGNMSTMHTRTQAPAVPTVPAVLSRAPLRFELAQNAPNPFNPATTIRMTLPEAGHTRLDIYNMNGQLLRTLINGNMPTGHHEVTWDGTDAAGNAIGSGIYIYRLTNGTNVQVRRMVLVR